MCYTIVISMIATSPLVPRNIKLIYKLAALATAAVLVLSFSLSAEISAQDTKASDAKKDSKQLPKSNVPTWLAAKKDILSGSLSLLISDLTGDQKIGKKDFALAKKALKDKGIEIKNLADGWDKRIKEPRSGKPSLVQDEMETGASEGETKSSSSGSGGSPITGTFFNRGVGTLSGTFDSISENEPSIAVNPTDSTKLIAGMHTFGFEWAFFECVAYRSSNSGSGWVGPIAMSPLLPGDFCSDPVVSWSSDGTRAYYTHMSIRSDFSTADIVVSTSTDGGATWSAPVVNFSGSLTDFMDKPWIAADKDPAAPNNVYASTTVFTSAGGCKILFSRSTDGGATWSPAVLMALSSVCSPIVVQGSNISADAGLLVVAWYDSLINGWLDGNFAIRAKQSTDKGVTFTSKTIYASPSDTELPFFLCPGVSFHRVWPSMFPRVDVRTISGTPHVGIAFSANTEGAGTQDCSDVLLAFSRNGGANYSIKKVSQETDNSAQYFPDVAIEGDGTMHVLWQDGRDTLKQFDPAFTPSLTYFEFLFTLDGEPVPNLLYRIFYSALKSDNTLSPERVAVDRFSASDFFFLGDYNDVVIGGNNLYFVYTDRRDGGGVTDIIAPLHFEDDVFFLRGPIP